MRYSKSPTNHKDLGIHSEMISDGIIQLYLDDVVNNRYKKFTQTKRLLLLPLVLKNYTRLLTIILHLLFDIDYVNNPHVIMHNDRVVAINSAIEVDITGQICADSIGTYHYSGIGGQMDFMYGASLSKAANPSLPLRAVPEKVSRELYLYWNRGAGVVTTRGHAILCGNWIRCCLFAWENIAQRAKALINISSRRQRGARKNLFWRFKIFSCYRVKCIKIVGSIIPQKN